MKLKSGFVLYSMDDEYVVVPIEERTNDFHGMIRLNKTGAFLWNKMESGFTKDSLTSALTEHYNVAKSDAETAVDSFIEKLAEVIER